MSCRGAPSTHISTNTTKQPQTKQAAHYFYTYLQLTKSDAAWDDTTTTPSPLPRITFAIPTGAAGHVTAGVIAALMGLPVEALVMATNEVGGCLGSGIIWGCIDMGIRWVINRPGPMDGGRAPIYACVLISYKPSYT